MNNTSNRNNKTRKTSTKEQKRHAIKILFKTRLLTTNRLEGLFGRARQIMRRFTHFQFVMIVSKLLRECLAYLNPKRKHNMYFGKSHYLDASNTSQDNITQCTKLYEEIKKKRNEKRMDYSHTDLIFALELAHLHHMPKVKILRASYYGAAYNRLGELVYKRDNKVPLDKTATVQISPESITKANEQQYILNDTNNTLSLNAKYSDLYKLKTGILPRKHTVIVMLDLEHNNKSEIISIAAYHAESENIFNSLAKQTTVGRSSVHNITLDRLKDAPRINHVMQSFSNFIHDLNATRVLLVAHS